MRAAEAGAGDEEQATFVITLPGAYSCSYLTHMSHVLSVPSETVTIEEYREYTPEKLNIKT